MIAAALAATIVATSGPGAAADLARRLAASAAAHGAEAPAGLFVTGAAPELARALQTLLAAELASRGVGAVPIEAPTAEASEAAARARGASCLVRLTVSLDAGKLTARGDLLGTRPNFWAGSSPTRPARPAELLYESVEADATALALATPGPAPAMPAQALLPLRLAGASLAHLTNPPAALATGDLDGDGKAEVAVLTDEEVLVYSGDGKLLARHEHRSLPDSETPCREPFGAIAVLPGPPRVLYFSARRARGEVLAYAAATGLTAVGTLDEAPLASVGDAVLGGRLGEGTNTFAPEVHLGARGAVRLSSPLSAVSVRANAFLFVHPDGTAGASAAGPAETLKLSGAGAGSGLVDLTGTGTLAVAASSPRFQADPDELRVFLLVDLEALGSKGARVDLAAAPSAWRSESLRGRVLAISAADLDGDKSDELVLAVWLADGTGELQVFRRGPP